MNDKETRNEHTNDRLNRDDSLRSPHGITRPRVMTFALIAATLIVFYLCYLLLEPFLPALAWAVALAVVARPMHEYIARRIRWPGIAAGVSVTAVTIVLVVPSFFVMQSLALQAIEGGKAVQEAVTTGQWGTESSSSWLSPAFAWFKEQIGLADIVQRATTYISSFVVTMVSGSVTAFVELLIVLFSLFYFFRDTRQAVGALRALLPLSRDESTMIFQRITETIQATVYGTLVVAIVQGTLGGLMFWWLGLPAPVLWGFVMAILAIVPVLGAFIIWIPAAILLAMDGDWTKAIILTAWGAAVIGLIDNLLYPILVGNKLRLHTLPVFFSIVGGLIVFGAAGLILGPVVLAVANGLVQLWRIRMRDQEEVETTKEETVPASPGS